MPQVTAAHQPLQAPTSSASSAILPAPAFLLAWLSYFIESSDPDLDRHKSKVDSSDFEALFDKYFLEDAVVEFPYLPRTMRESMPVQPLTSDDEDGGKLVGKSEIIAYFGKWRSTFWLSSGNVKTLSALAVDQDEAVIEARLQGKLVNTDELKAYSQDYVSFVKLNQSGKVVVYREHWAANRFA